ncbi:MAG: choice-of-anchor L domain-containing protein [Phaeodactylibacter sp.]|uniref:choice-of-anchor L domain-containing protein n=1 Tax=Phaeodactylibacter sp. TaxID=1940289 RepID=UPI0032ED67D6
MMKKTTTSITLFLCTLFSGNALFAQSNLFVDTSYTASEMVTAFFSDADVAPSNVTYTGAPEGMAFFDAGDTYLGINAGIFLSTGPVTAAANPASFDATFNSLDQPGDTDLQQLLAPEMMTFDASVLEFDIVPSTDTICFNYIFGSEEYPEFVGTNFNDVFAFFISGGPEYDSLTNIATVPDSDPVVPVTINNLNADSNSSFYIPQFIIDTLWFNTPIYDTAATDLAYDAYTTLLPAKAYVTPGETYHIKIGIADAGDGIYDSGVFIGITSLGGDSLLTPTANANLSVIDNQLIAENTSSFAKAFEWDFGDGTISAERHPEPHTYAEYGTYTVALNVHTWCCSSTFVETVTVAPPLLTNFGVTPEARYCPGDAFSFEDLSEGAVDTWSWAFPGGQPATADAPNPTVTYNEPGVYPVMLTVTDTFGQTATLEMEAAVEIQDLPTAAFEATANELQVAFQNNTEHATSYLWDFGDDQQSTEQSPTHTYASEGSYTVTLTAMNDCGEAVAVSEVSVMVVSTRDLPATAFALFPNPVKEWLIVESSAPIEQIIIYNTSGQEVYRKDWRGIFQGQLSVTDWPTGMYCLQARAANQVISQTFIVAQ